MKSPPSCFKALFVNVWAYLFQVGLVSTREGSKSLSGSPVNCIKPSPFLSTRNFPFLLSMAVASFQLHERFQERQTTKTTEVLIDILLILSTAKLQSLHRRKFVFCRLLPTRYQRQVLIANKSFIRKKKCISWSSMMEIFG